MAAPHLMTLVQDGGLLAHLAKRLAAPHLMTLVQDGGLLAHLAKRLAKERP